MIVQPPIFAHSREYLSGLEKVLLNSFPYKCEGRIIPIKKKLLEKVKKIWNVFRPVAILIAFYFLFRNVNFQSLWNSLTGIQWWTVTLFMVCALNGMIFQGVRWWVLICAFTDKLSFTKSMNIHFTTAFYSLILPNSTVQDVLRTLYATKTTGYVIGWSSAWINKIIGIVVSFSFSVIGLTLLPDLTIPTIAYQIIFALFFLMCIALVLSFTKKFSSPIRKLLLSRFPGTSFTWIEKIREGIYEFRNKRKMLLLSFTLTIGSQLFLLGGVSLLLYGITGNAYIIEVITFIPLIEMISMAQPFTPGGIGVRESLIALMFQHLNLSNEQFAIYVLVSNLSIFLKLIGALPVLINYVNKRKLKIVS